MSDVGQTRKSPFSFDHFVSAGDEGGRKIKAKGFCRLQVNHQIIFGRSLDRKIGRLLALENAIDITGRAPKLVDAIGPVENQPAAVDIVPVTIHGRKSVPGCQLDDKVAMHRHASAGRYDQTSISGIYESRHRALDLTAAARVDGADLYAQRLRRGLYGSKLRHRGGIVRKAKNSRPPYVRLDLFEKLQPFRREAVLKKHEASGVAARLSKVIDEPGTGWIGYAHEYDRQCMGDALHRSHAHCATGQDNVRREIDKFFGVFALQTDIVLTPSNVNLQIRANFPPELLQGLLEGRNARLTIRIICGAVHENADPSGLPGLLGA